jgi:hypothetical protein
MPILKLNTKMNLSQNMKTPMRSKQSTTKLNPKPQMRQKSMKNQKMKPSRKPRSLL